MNAAELIDQFKQLPCEEQGKVVEFINHIPNKADLEIAAGIDRGLQASKDGKVKSHEEVKELTKSWFTK